jgi:glycolate oxidase subunit GlcD
LHTKLLKAFQKFLKQDQILVSETDLKIYDTDATALFKNKAHGILLARSVSEIQEIIKTINEFNLKQDEGDKISFLARGAGTGLSGGAIANPQTIIISVAALNKILEIDPVNQKALIETGLINSHLTQKAKKHSLQFSPDPSSQDSCTIGGNIAENAGGIHCYKHGVSSDQVLGLEYVDEKGELCYLGELNPELKSRDIDLAKFFSGSEGTFGIVTKALVKLDPVADSFVTIEVACRNTLDASKIVSEIIKHGLKPAALEMIDSGAIEAVNRSFKMGLSEEVKAILLIEFDGHNEEVLIHAQETIELIETRFDLIFIKTTQDLKERKNLWQIRKGTVAAFGEIAPYWYLYDSVVPRSKIPQAMLGIEDIAERNNLKLASVCHAADGNLHPNFLYDPDKDPGVIDRIHKASEEVMQICIHLGGVLSGEHGIGLEKREFMPYMFTKEEMDLMFKVRKVFDPELKNNPDKIFPIRVCKEC